LAEGADILAAADSGLMAAEDAGLRPDWIIGDMDSLDELRRLEKYPPGRVIRYSHDKDHTDTELALALLWEKGCDETWLIGGGGGRTDHLLAIRALFDRERCPERWITAADDIRCVRDRVSLTLPPGSRVSVFPAGSGPWRAKSRGLRWPLDGVAWKGGSFGISNIAPEGAFFIRAEAGRFLVISPRE
jgi:thiamine pyrophosphokinase